MSAFETKQNRNGQVMVKNSTIETKKHNNIVENTFPWIRWCSYTQWGRRLEGWSNTAARLAGWGRATRQVWFCTWSTGRISCLFRTVPAALTGAAQLRTARISSCCYVENVHNHFNVHNLSDMEGGRYSRNHQPPPILHSDDSSQDSSDSTGSSTWQPIKYDVIKFR